MKCLSFRCSVSGQLAPLVCLSGQRAGLGWAGEKNLGAVRVELVLGVMRLDENTKKMRTHNKKEEAFEA